MRERSVFPAVNPQAVVVLQRCSATRELTDEEFHLVGYGRNLLDRQGEPMYFRARANRGSQLRRIGATDNCIVCGMPTLPICPHSYARSASVAVPGYHAGFRLCWHHHHECYDQG